MKINSFILSLEEVAAKNLSLNDIVTDIANLICDRAADTRNFGIILVPEGLIEFIGEVNILIQEINEILATQANKPTLVSELIDFVAQHLTEQSAKLLKFLPISISEQLLLDRDPHGNVQVAKIETEKLLIMLLQVELEKRKKEGKYQGEFTPQSHYFGYEGRCAFPSTFDCDYCYCLGLNAAALVDSGYTGMMSVVRNVGSPSEQWVPGGCPLVSMMNVERRKGKDVPVIKKALVELDGPLFKLFEQERKGWREHDYYRSPGPIQFEFPLPAPYLACPPTKEQLYDHTKKEYVEESKPYARIFPLSNISDLAFARAKDRPRIPAYLRNNSYNVILSSLLDYHSQETKHFATTDYKYLTSQPNNMRLIEVTEKAKTEKSTQYTSLKKKENPLRIGIVFCGRQTPGVHNIVVGLQEFARGNNGEVLGFIGGTKGFFNKEYIKVTDESLEYYINQGGMHFLGRSADKIRTPTELEATLKCCQELKLDGIVLVGATHTLTDAIIVTNYLLEHDCKTSVIGVPASVDGNVYHHMLEGIVGFDSASKLYSQLIGNIMIDAASATKYWY